MGEQSNIGWTDDTWNSWIGCRRISPGCVHCYIEFTPPFRTSGMKHGGERKRFGEATRNAPLRWNKKPLVCNFCGESNPLHQCMCSGCSVKIQHFTGAHRRRVFSLSLGDWLDDEVPAEWLAEMLDVILRCPDLNFLLLTKRPENFYRRLTDAWEYDHEHGDAGAAWISRWIQGKAPSNIWLGTSVENQAMADLRIPQLLRIPAAVRFLSVEPLLEDVKLVLDNRNGPDLGHMAFIDWVIVGGESGDKRRDCGILPIISVARQCTEANVPVFVKQDCDRKPGQQGRIPDSIWKLKQFPK